MTDCAIRDVIRLDEILKDASTAAITGHTGPDGDCIGSTVGFLLYLQDRYPQIETEVYLERLPERFYRMAGTEKVKQGPTDKTFDVLFVLDCNTPSRLGKNAFLLKQAKVTVCIDHHVSQGPFGDIIYVEPEASSASELICHLAGPENLSPDAAALLYMGIAHDTGVFQYTCTSSRTMNVAGVLMDKGIPFTDILQKTYYEQTYYQNQILGRALLESIRFFDNRVIVSVIRRKDMEFYKVTRRDLDSIVPQLRSTEGVEVAIFIYETGSSQWKVSLRSVSRVDVNEIASYFGGGGHVRAAGCEMQGSVYDVINNLSDRIALQLN